MVELKDLFIQQLRRLLSPRSSTHRPILSTVSRLPAPTHGRKAQGSGSSTDVSVAQEVYKFDDVHTGGQP